MVPFDLGLGDERGFSCKAGEALGDLISKHDFTFVDGANLGLSANGSFSSETVWSPGSVSGIGDARYDVVQVEQAKLGEGNFENEINLLVVLV